MAARPLDLQVLRNGKPEGSARDHFQATADPEDLAGLSGRLRGWLAANHWHEKRWGEFELAVRESGASKLLVKVRAR